MRHSDGILAFKILPSVQGESDDACEVDDNHKQDRNADFAETSTKEHQIFNQSEI